MQDVPEEIPACEEISMIALQCTRLEVDGGES